MIVEKIVVGLAFLVIIAIAYATFCVAIALGEPIDGQDFLAAQQARFDAVLAVSNLSGDFATGNLDWTFGADLAPVEKLLQAHPKFHRVHFFNGPCIRGGNCGKYEPSFGFSLVKWESSILKGNSKILSTLKLRVALYRDLCARYPQTKCLVSPELEHNLSRKAWRVLADSVLEVWPEAQLVNSPVGGIPIERYRGAWIERHGTKPQSDADIVSTDGEEVTDTDTQAFLARTNRPQMKIRYAWSRVYNCRSNGPFLDPRKRVACPTKSNFEEIAHIFDVRGPAPLFLSGSACKKILSFDAPRIWKPMADDHGNGDSRANKPVILIKSKVPFLDVLASNGTSIGRIPLYKDPHPHDMERYYSSVQGYEFEKRAKNLTGFPHAWLRAEKTCVGPIVGGRRNGLMR